MFSLRDPLSQAGFVGSWIYHPSIARKTGRVGVYAWATVNLVVQGNVEHTSCALDAELPCVKGVNHFLRMQTLAGSLSCRFLYVCAAVPQGIRVVPLAWSLPSGFALTCAVPPFLLQDSCAGR